MIVWIIFAAVIIYVLTLGIMLYVTAKDEDFECVGDLFEWVYRYDPVVLIPVINTICLVFTVIFCPILWLFNKIGQIKLPQKAKCLPENAFSSLSEEDKQLLLKDLCGRLPYSVRGEYVEGSCKFKSHIFDCGVLSLLVYLKDTSYKPYLFPLLSMTPKQKAELAWLVRDEENLFRIALIESDFYNKNHIDYRGLLERGLAIDCSRLKIY